MKIKNAFHFLLISWLISIVAIFGVSFALVHTVDDSQAFWYRVFWTAALNTIFWFGASGWFNIKSAGIAIVPSLSFVIGLTCLFSFGLMLFAAFQPTFLNIQHYHIAAQIVLFALSALISTGLQVAGHYAATDTVLPPNAAKSPLVLCDTLELLERSLSAHTSATDTKLAQNLKSLREKIRYSLQDSPKTRVNPEYVSFVGSVESLCATTESTVSSGLPADNLELNSAISKLISQVQILSSSMARSR
jgi:hypothetical protein